VEYTKSLSSFQLHHSMTPKQLFLVVLQVSRFFKEFSDFEGEGGRWRRGGLEGKQGEAEVNEGQRNPPTPIPAKGVRELVRGLRINNYNNIHSYPDSTREFVFEEEEEVPLEVEVKEKEKSRDGKNTVSYLQDIGLEGELKNLKMLATQQREERKPHELLKIAVPSAKVQFIEYFKSILRDRKTKQSLIEPDKTTPCYLHEEGKEQKKIIRYYT